MIPEGMAISVTRIDFPQNPEVLHTGYFFLLLWFPLLKSEL